MLRWIWSQLIGIWHLLSGVGRVPLSQSELEDELLDTRRIVFAIQPVVTFVLIALTIVCWPQFAKGLLWAFACLAVGFVLGFLFGIPKVVQRESARTTGDGYHQRVNTNLEEISDWVTKIIVGLSIYQLDKVPERIDVLAVLFASSVHCDEKMRGVFGAAIVFFFVCGFLLGYLVTRLYFQGAFGRADRSVAPDEPKQKRRDRQKTGAPEDGHDDPKEETANVEPNQQGSPGPNTIT